ncbi:MAG TPA: PIG-L deacetylase family protein, partial [Gaiellaceae bacterium]
MGLGGGAPVSRVLALGAHADDIEIGCGGTLLELAGRHDGLQILFVVLSGDEPRASEARESAEALLGDAVALTVEVAGFRDGYFPYEGAAVKDAFEDLKERFEPDLVLTHHRHDLHQDHRLVCELTWNTFRDHLILEYEVPKYDGDIGTPNVFVHLSEDVVRRKVDALLTHFPSQRGRRWFTEDLFLALLRLRGMESNSPTGWAEAFHSRKLVLA